MTAGTLWFWRDFEKQYQQVGLFLFFGRGLTVSPHASGLRFDKIRVVFSFKAAFTLPVILLICLAVVVNKLGCVMVGDG